MVNMNNFKVATNQMSAIKKINSLSPKKEEFEMDEAVEVNS